MKDALRWSAFVEEQIFRTFNSVDCTHVLIKCTQSIAIFFRAIKIFEITVLHISEVLAT